MEYDYYKQAIRYREVITSTDGPDLTKTLNYTNVRYFAENKVAEYDLTEHQTGTTAYNDETGALRTRTIYLTTYTQRRGTVYMSLGPMKYYRDRITIEGQDLIKDIEWYGTSIDILNRVHRYVDTTHAYGTDSDTGKPV